MFDPILCKVNDYYDTIIPITLNIIACGVLCVGFDPTKEIISNIEWSLFTMNNQETGSSNIWDSSLITNNCDLRLIKILRMNFGKLA